MHKENLKEKIIRDTGSYSLAHYFSQGIGVITSVALRRFLGPYYMGIWGILQVIQSYFAYLLLGVNSAAVYRIPYYKGRGDFPIEKEIRDTSFSFIFMISVLSCVLLVLAAWFLRNKYPLELIVGIIALAIYIVLQRVYSFYIIVLRAYKNFRVLSMSMIFDALMNLVLVYLLVRYFKIYGFYVVISLLVIFNTLFIHLFAKHDISFNFTLKRLRELISFGLPLLLNNILSIFLRTIDKIMIASMLGITYVGYYSVALMTKNYVYGISNNLGIVSIPHMQEIYSKNSNVKDIKGFVIVSAEAISYILAPMLGFVFLLSPLFVKKILPQYVSGIIALQILLLDIYFISLSQHAGQFIITINKQMCLIPISVATIFLNIVFNYYFIRQGLGISGVALGTALASFFACFVKLVFAMSFFSNSKEILKFLINFVFPPLVIAAWLFLYNFNLLGLGVFSNLFITLGFLLVVSFVMFRHINKKTRIFNILVAKIFSIKIKTLKP